MPVSDVFVIMPFGEQTVMLSSKKVTYDTAHFDDLYDLIKEAVVGFDPTIKVERMEKKHGNLVAAIIRRIYDADLVIAVLSGRNPNVFYELGVRHALRRGTIMLVSDRNEYPFDLKGYYSEQYSIDTGKDRKQLKDFLVERLNEYSAEMLDDSPVLDVLEVAEREQWRAVSNWEARRAAMVFRGLLGNVSLLSGWGQSWLKEVNRWRTESANDYVPEQVARVSVGALNTFAQSFPVIGLTSHAYIDTANLATLYEELDVNLSEVNVPLEVHPVAKMTDDERKDFAAFVGSRLLNFVKSLILFADDVCTALEYVIRERKGHSIPWPESIDGAAEITDPEEFAELQKRVADRIVAVATDYLEFEVRFSGAPPMSND